MDHNFLLFWYFMINFRVLTLLHTVYNVNKKLTRMFSNKNVDGAQMMINVGMMVHK